jgi:acetyl esterase/lipase
MATEQAKHMAELFASVSERTSKPGLDLATIRDISERLHLCGTEPEGVTYAEVDADGVHALWCVPEGSDTDHVLMHCHNGGGVLFSIYTDRKAAGHLARAAGVRVLVVDFGLAPEHPFPAQIDDVERVYQWLLAQGYRPENIVSSGHSIGGNFAVSLVVRLRDKGIALPGAILSISPWSDIEMKSKTLDSNASTDNLSRQQLESFREVWLAGTGVTWDDPRINLLYADLTGLPPTMVHYGTGEILVGEIIEFVQRAKHAGVDISLHTVPEGQHSFIMGAGRVPEADEAIEQMGRWVRTRLSLDDMRHSVPSRALPSSARQVGAGRHHDNPV